MDRRSLRYVWTLLLAVPMLIPAQDKPPAPSEPTIAELKFQLAQKDVELANIKLQLIQAQAQGAYCAAQNDLAKAQDTALKLVPKQTETAKK